MLKINSILLLMLISSCTSGLFDNKNQITDSFDTLVNNGEFPCYQLADSLYGVDSRGTDQWCETAYCKKDYDYHIDIHYDTVWLYNNKGELVAKGSFDSIPELITKDNN